MVDFLYLYLGTYNVLEPDAERPGLLRDEKKLCRRHVIGDSSYSCALALGNRSAADAQLALAGLEW